MPRVLTEEQVETYHRDGFVAPIDLLTEVEAAALRRGIEDIEAGIEGEMQARFKIKAHLPFPFLCDVIANPRLLDAVEDIIGREITIMADKDIPYRLLKKVMVTCTQSDYGQIAFAVLQKSSDKLDSLSAAR